MDLTPTPLNLSCFCQSCVSGETQHKYHLYAVVVHKGTGIERGHYFSYVRSLGNGGRASTNGACCSLDTVDDGQWYFCDDHRITQIDQNVLESRLRGERRHKTETPSLLFYARSDTFDADDRTDGDKTSSVDETTFADDEDPAKSQPSNDQRADLLPTDPPTTDVSSSLLKVKIKIQLRTFGTNFFVQLPNTYIRQSFDSAVSTSNHSLPNLGIG